LLFFNTELEFLASFLDPTNRAQRELVTDALRRAHAYFQAGADCVFPIARWETEALTTFIAQAAGQVNILSFKLAPSLAELTRLRVVRVSYGSLLHRDLMEKFRSSLISLVENPAIGTGAQCDS